jgi:hypothetical protein
MNNHINQEMLRLERVGKGMPLKSYKDDSAKKALAIIRRGIANSEAEEKLEDIKTSVDRFKVDRYFNNLSTSIATIINNYLQGNQQNDTGSIIPTYNELCMYLKTVIKWKTLSENDRNMITAKFNELLPQVNELMDVAITEKYTDRKQIAELKNNIEIRNYVPIVYKNYAEKIISKKPEYKEIRDIQAELYDILTLKEDIIPEYEKQQLENDIADLEKYQNIYISSTSKEKRKFAQVMIKRKQDRIMEKVDEIQKRLETIPDEIEFTPSITYAPEETEIPEIPELPEIPKSVSSPTPTLSEINAKYARVIATKKAQVTRVQNKIKELETKITYNKPNIEKFIKNVDSLKKKLLDAKTKTKKAEAKRDLTFAKIELDANLPAYNAILADYNRYNELFVINKQKLEEVEKNLESEKEIYYPSRAAPAFTKDEFEEHKHGDLGTPEYVSETKEPEAAKKPSKKGKGRKIMSQKKGGIKIKGKKYYLL